MKHALASGRDRSDAPPSAPPGRQARATAGLKMAGACLCATLALSTGAQAEGRWRVSTGQGSGNAMVLSLSTMTTGSRNIEYRPALVVSCNGRRDPVWRQSVQIRRPISGEALVGVAVRYDGAAASTEQWALADLNRTLQVDGEQALARLARARRLHLNWRFGLLSGRGEAVFDVSGAGEALRQLAEACGIEAPD